MAIVKSVLLLHPYLKKSRFTMGSDHDALKWILSVTAFIERLALLRLRHSKFDFDVSHPVGVNTKQLTRYHN